MFIGHTLWIAHQFELHTPGGKKIDPGQFIGTGMYGKLPIMPEVYAAAEKEWIEVVALPTPELCGKLLKLKSKDVNAVLHVTC